MAKKTFWKSNLFKVLLFFVVFLIIAFFGGILFDWGYRFRKCTIFLRGAYMSIAVIWVVGCIWWISYRFRFGDKWRGMIEDFYAHQEDFERDMSKEYQVLLSKYPIAVAQYESKCWKQNPRPTNVEIMDNALKISDSEWEEREKEAKEKLNGRLEKH